MWPIFVVVVVAAAAVVVANTPAGKCRNNHQHDMTVSICSKERRRSHQQTCVAWKHVHSLRSVLGEPLEEGSLPAVAVGN